LYILLEFQSQPDRWIALRMLVYAGMLNQTLIKNGVLPRPDKLPPILPIVLYNGARRWNAAMDLAQLVEPLPHWLDRWQPRQRCCLIDERALDLESPGRQVNLAAALFQMERARSPEDLRHVVSRLKTWLSGDIY